MCKFKKNKIRLGVWLLIGIFLVSQSMCVYANEISGYEFETVSQNTVDTETSSEAEYTFSIGVNYNQTEARKVLGYVNTFRQSDDAWAWNADNTTKQIYSNLGTLTYDYRLEEIAMQRAAEIAFAFEHNRPNGHAVDPMFTWYSGFGENIAAGTSVDTAAEVFEMWEEEDGDYAAQCHRRNMLQSEARAIGIGHVVYNGIHYWTMELGTPVSNQAAVGACDSYKVVSVDVLKSYIHNVAVTTEAKSYTVNIGESIEIPKANVTVQSYRAGFSNLRLPIITTNDFEVEDTQYAKISSGYVNGLKEGLTNLHITVLGKSYSVPLIVEDPNQIEAFDPKRDGNSFTNNNSKKKDGFSGENGYRLSKEYLKIYTKGMSDGEKSKFKKLLKKTKWYGACYGMAVTAGLCHEDKLSTVDMGGLQGQNYYDLKPPYNNDKLLNVINMYHLAQYRIKDISDYTTYAYSDTVTTVLKENEMRPISTEEILKLICEKAQEDEVFMMCYARKKSSSGHAVLVTGYKKYDSENNEHVICLFDGNSVEIDNPGYLTELRISDDYKKFQFVDAMGYTVNQKNYSFMDITDLDAFSYITEGIKTESSNQYTKIEFPIDEKIKIVNEKNEYLQYDGENFSGNMAIYRLYPIVSDEMTKWVIKVDNSTKYNVTYMSDNADIEIYSDKRYMSLSGLGIKGTNFTDDTMNIQGDNYSFCAFMLAGNDTDICVEANANSDVDIRVNDGSLTANTTGAMSNINTEIFYGDEVKQKTYTHSMQSFRESLDGENGEFNNAQTDQIEAFVKRMYTVALNREAEAAGLKDWSSQLAEQKIDGAGIANGFINSAEFTNRNLSNTDFLDTLYETFFNRPADAGGKAYWLQQLWNGMSRTEVLSGFVNSQEFSNLCDNYGIARGTMQPNGTSIYRPGVRNYVLRMYTKALNRDGETVGVEDWTNRINTGTMSAENVAKSFFSSQEFINRNLSNSAYVETLYQTFMDRPSDASGKQYWINKLNSGMSREQVLEGFSRSAEFSEIMSRYGL